MFDAHAHLQDTRLSGNREVVLRRAAETGVTGVCCCATSPADWDAVAAFIRDPTPFVVVPAFGVHPWYAENLPADWLERLNRTLDAHPAAALGEVGLDGIRKSIPFEVQRQCLVSQLELAACHRIPVVLHGARAWEPLLETIRPFREKIPGFLIHGFSGSPDQMRRFLDLGAAISIAGSVCNPQAKKIRAAAKELPDSQLLIETDSPDLFPVGGTSLPGTPAGKPVNHPANLRQVLETVAALRDATPDAIADLTGANARRILL
ncbi:MAG: TatD family hydrolase [Kiritimatiellae bacterium]|nr:TatD family hydrolase [Kiritimatiellia bacterium]